MSKPINKVVCTMFAIALVLVLVAAGLIVWKRPDRALRVATGNVAQTLCADVFVTGLAPNRVLAENIEPLPGMRMLLPRLHYAIDRVKQNVTAKWHGRFVSVATYYPGYGCALPTMTPDAATLQAAHAVVFTAPPSPDLAITNVDPAIIEALTRAFAEPPGGSLRHVHAIVVMHDGKLIAERYAAGFSPESPQLGYSMSKSIVNALLGILVRQGKLDMAMPAPVAAWAAADDPRHGITLDQLSRMTSGLDLTEDDSGFDPVSNMLLLQKDMAAFAAHAALRIPPGTRWEYTSGNTLILGGVLRNYVGGGAPGLIRFAHRELFDPLGMQPTSPRFQ